MDSRTSGSRWSGSRQIVLSLVVSVIFSQMYATHLVRPFSTLHSQINHLPFITEHLHQQFKTPTLNTQPSALVLILPIQVPLQLSKTRRMCHGRPSRTSSKLSMQYRESTRVTFRGFLSPDWWGSDTEPMVHQRSGGFGRGLKEYGVQSVGGGGRKVVPMLLGAYCEHKGGCRGEAPEAFSGGGCAGVSAWVMSLKAEERRPERRSSL